MRRCAVLAAVIVAAAVAGPTRADRFEPDPTNCHHTVHHGSIRVTFTSARYTSCTEGSAVANAWAPAADCHDTRYCTVHAYSCKNTFHRHGAPVAHCRSVHGAGEVFLSWHRAG